jgi:hypothetical protein
MGQSRHVFLGSDLADIIAIAVILLDNDATTTAGNYRTRQCAERVSHMLRSNRGNIRGRNSRALAVVNRKHDAAAIVHSLANSGSLAIVPRSDF